MKFSPLFLLHFGPSDSVDPTPFACSPVAFSRDETLECSSQRQRDEEHRVAPPPEAEVSVAPDRGGVGALHHRDVLLPELLSHGERRRRAEVLTTVLGNGEGVAQEAEAVQEPRRETASRWASAAGSWAWRRRRATDGSSATTNSGSRWVSVHLQCHGESTAGTPSARRLSGTYPSGILFGGSNKKKEEKHVNQ